MTVEYVVAAEQHPVAQVLIDAGHAISRGFDGVFLSDRYQPWLPSHGSAPFAWAMAGALAHHRAPLTVSAVPGYRMHPAAIAQATMTVAALSTRTHTLVLSPGNAIDEHVVGGYWPETHERVARLMDAADAVRKLVGTVRRRSDVRHAGPHHRLETSRLWFDGDEQCRPRLLLWAGSPATARRAAGVADGIVITAGGEERTRALIRSAREGAAAAGRDPASVSVGVHAQLCWAPSAGEAEAAAVRDWPMAGLRFPPGDIRSPFDVEHLAHSVTLDDVRRRILVSADPAAHRVALERLVGLGADTLYVHNVAREQTEWIDVFGDRIRKELP